MTPTTKKTAAEAGTSTTVNESDQHSHNNDSTLIFGHLGRPGKSTGKHYVTWGDEKLPHDEYMAVYIARSELVHAVPSPEWFKVCASCVDEHDAEIDRRQAEAHAQEHRKRERAALVTEEKKIIKNLTGMDLVRDDLVVFMTQARRDGDDFQPFLDALQAIDDLDLERAGLTTWDVDLDDLEEGGNDED